MKSLFIRLAFRNIVRQKRRSILTGLTIAVGFLLLSVSIGISEGSYSDVIRLFTKSHTCHIQIHKGDYLKRPSIYNTLHDVTIPDMPFIISWTPRIYAPALAFGNNKTLATQMIGIDIDRELNTTTLAAKLITGSFSLDGVVITKSMSQLLNASIGDELVLISQGADGSIANSLFPIHGISDEQEGVMLCYLALSTAQEFLSLGTRIHEIAIMTDSYSNAPRYAATIASRIADSTLDIQPWQVVEKSFYNAMKMDIKGMWISLGIIMFIVAMGVLNTVFMNIIERTREYGILKALGTTPLLLFNIIVSEIMLLTAMSTLIAFIPTFFTNWFLTRHGIHLSEPLEFGGVLFTTYRSTLSLNVFLIPAFLIMTTSLIVSIIPAIGISRKHAVEAMKHV